VCVHGARRHLTFRATPQEYKLFQQALKETPKGRWSHAGEKVFFLTAHHAPARVLLWGVRAQARRQQTNSRAARRDQVPNGSDYAKLNI
jgi:hypothetical protein